MAYEIPASVEKIMDAMEEIPQAHTEDLSLCSYLAKYQIVCGHGNILKAEVPKVVHEKRKPHNREYIAVHLEHIVGKYPFPASSLYCLKYRKLQ